MVLKIDPDTALSLLTDDERQWVGEFSRRVKRRLGERLKDFRIFGSKVRGDFHEESDIDLLVLVDQCKPEDRDGLIDAAHSISTWLDVRVVDFDRYHSPSSRATGFYEEMRAESVRL